jgi:hypothetical protein
LCSGVLRRVDKLYELALTGPDDATLRASNQIAGAGLELPVLTRVSLTEPRDGIGFDDLVDLAGEIRQEMLVDPLNLLEVEQASPCRRR